MNECQFCRWRGGQHGDGCPESSDAKKDAFASYSRGWEEGRKGQECGEGDRFYTCGWINGMCALEEAENGHDPRFD